MPTGKALNQDSYSHATRKSLDSLLVLVGMCIYIDRSLAAQVAW